MKRSENAIAVYKSLYMNPDEKTVEEVHRRVATCIGENGTQIQTFEKLLNDNIFRPNSPCLINSWNNTEHQSKYNNNLVACFVVGLEDTMDSIINMWNTCATVYAGGGGTGFCISNLRESGSPISIGGKASGPIEYMKVIQSISDTVKSGGKARRAANLASFWYKHPDSLDFVNCKKNYDFGAINISVLVDDEFMSLVDAGKWDHVIKLESPNKKINIEKTVTVKQLWDAIINNAWSSGDPGLLFFDTINKSNPIPSRGAIRSTNPCGEVPLSDDSCCDLGSLNLNSFLVLKENQNNGNKYKFDYDLFKLAIKPAIEFLDRVIDITSFPNEKFRKTMEETRPLGLGIMGFADILYKMNIPYGSDESVKLFEMINQCLTATSYEVSIDLAETKGAINLGSDVQNMRDLLKLYGVSDEYLLKFDKVGIRNSNVTSLAPTGSISISAECCYAFEPMMALVWEKPLSDRDITLKFINEEFLTRCKELNIDLNETLMNKIINNSGSIQNIDIFPETMRSVFITAHDVGWSKKIDMQAAGQKYISLAISSTCNLPNSATVSDVEKAYIKAWKLKLKGITVYRDGSLSTQPVNFGKITSIDSITSELNRLLNNEPIKLPLKRPGETVKFKSPHGSVYITCNKVNTRIVEIFLSMGKSGQLESLLMKNLSKQISKSLHYRVPIEVILDQMEGEGGHPFWFKLDEVKDISIQGESVLDAIAKMIRYHFVGKPVDGYVLDDVIGIVDSSLEICPVCKNRTLQRAAGCRGGSCMDPICGYSACG